MARGIFEGEVVEVSVSNDGKWANLMLGQEAYQRPTICYGATDQLGTLPVVGERITAHGFAQAKVSKAGAPYISVRIQSWEASESLV